MCCLVGCGFRMRSVRRLIRFPMRNLWCAGWSTRKCASRVSEGLDDIGVRDRDVLVCSVHGLGFGSSVTVVVRLDD
jgi:hypothetical protein